MDLSVVMAVYNQSETLNAAIKSILEQTYRNFVFIIIDDFSTDETPEILRQWRQQDPRIKVVTNHRHLGLTKSLNVGWRLAKTIYIARMDADDIAMPSRLKKQRDFLLAHPKIGLLGASANLIDGQGRPAGVKIMPSDSDSIRRTILSYCPFIHPTWMLPRNVLLEMGGYNEAFPFAQDYELALRIVKTYPVANLLEVLLEYRVNSESAISLKQLKQQELLALKARWLALTRYGYSWRQSWRLIKPLLSFMVPSGIKKLVYARYFWYRGSH